MIDFFNSIIEFFKQGFNAISNAISVMQEYMSALSAVGDAVGDILSEFPTPMLVMAGTIFALLVIWLIITLLRDFL